MSQSSTDKQYSIAYRAARLSAVRLPDEELTSFIAGHVYRCTEEPPPSREGGVDARTDELVRRGMCAEVLEWWKNPQLRA